MTKRLPVLCLGLLLAMGGAAAQTQQQPKKVGKQGKVPFAETAAAPKAPWISEPSTFLGVTLGMLLKDQPSMPKCAKPGNVEPFCYWELGLKEPNPKYLSTWNAPNLLSGVAVNVTLVLNDGEVHGVVLTMPHSSSEEFLELLKGKYGDPHEVSLATYQNRGGATFEGHTYNWRGPSVSMSFAEYGSRLDEAAFQIFTTRYDAIKAAERKANIEKSKDKL